MSDEMTDEEVRDFMSSETPPVVLSLLLARLEEVESQNHKLHEYLNNLHERTARLEQVLEGMRRGAPGSPYATDVSPYTSSPYTDRLLQEAQEHERRMAQLQPQISVSVNAEALEALEALQRTMGSLEVGEYIAKLGEELDEF